MALSRYLSVSAITSAEKYTIEELGIPAIVLMERAALASYEELSFTFDMTHVLIVAGNGNNGGDGLALARLLKEKNIPVTICCPGGSNHGSDLFKEQLLITEKLHIPQIDLQDLDDLSPYTTIVDAIFGIGLDRDIIDTYAIAIHQINASNIPVFSIDIPSGIAADSGEILGTAIKAKTTLCLQFGKNGLLQYPGDVNAGDVRIAPIGIWSRP